MRFSSGLQADLRLVPPEQFVFALHHFTGVSMTDPGRQRDWVLTRVWSLSMDAVAIGMIVLVLSGIYLWYRLEAKRRLGLAVLALGVLCCAFFLVGLSSLS